MSKEKKEKLTKAKMDSFKGKDLLGIWEVDEDGNTVSDYPIVSFGLGKAKAILKHIDEIQKFVEEA